MLLDICTYTKTIVLIIRKQIFVKLHKLAILLSLSKSILFDLPAKIINLRQVSIKN